MTHNIFYTAITRAREKLKIYWTPEVEEKVINRIKPRDISKDVELLRNYIKAICAIIYFGKIHSLDDWKNEFSDYPDVQLRIKESLETENYRYGAEISAIQIIEPISLNELKKNIPNFVAPQSYLLLENNNKLKEYIERHTSYVGDLIKNDLESIYPEHVCKRY